MFKDIKEYFIKRKNEKEQQKSSCYLIEKHRSDTLYIVDESFVALMFATMSAPEGIMASEYADCEGFHKGNDGRVYKKYVLNDKGLKSFDHNKLNALIYIEALKEIITGKSTNNYSIEKNNIRVCCRKSFIKSISIYEGKELANEIDFEKNNCQ